MGISPHRRAFMQLDDPSLFINRGLSWLEFNQRVLDQALDKTNPLLERLKFLCIVSSNLDEFFEVRVAGLKQQVQTQHVAPAPDGVSPKSELAALSKRARKQVDEQYACWIQEIRPWLAAQNIRFHDFPTHQWLKEFERTVFDKFSINTSVGCKIDVFEKYPPHGWLNRSNWI